MAKINGEEVVKLKPRQRPVHLAEDEFFGLVHDERLPEQITEYLKGEVEDDAKIELYYSFLSKEGLRAPRDIDFGEIEDDECAFDEITEDDQISRKMEIKRIRDCCISLMKAP